MKYRLRNGRIVSEGDYVQVRLTPRIIGYLKSINGLFDYPEEGVHMSGIDNLVDTLEQILKDK